MSYCNIACYLVKLMTVIMCMIIVNLLVDDSLIGTSQERKTIQLYI